MTHYHKKPLAITIASLMSLSLSAQSNDLSDDISVNTVPQLPSLEEVVVHGSKQNLKLKDVNASVGIMTAEQLQSQPITDINDVFARMANINAVQSEQSQFAIRGVDVIGPANNATQPASTASVTLDGAELGSEAIRWGAMPVWDVQQIEVFRGPQATLQGRNSLSGAINIKTMDPSFDTDIKAQVEAGNYNTSRASFAAGGALVDGLLAARISIDDYQTDGFINNVTRGEEDAAYQERRNIRAKLLFTPTEDLSAKLTLSRITGEFGDGPSARDDNPFSYEAVSNIKSVNDNETDVAVLELGYDISDALKLTSITSYQDNQWLRLDDFDSSAFDAGYIAQDNEDDNITQELRLNFEGESIRGVTGIYYSEIDYRSKWTVESLQPSSEYRGAGIEGLTFSLNQALPAMIQPSVEAYLVNVLGLPAQTAAAMAAEQAAEMASQASPEIAVGMYDQVPTFVNLENFNDNTSNVTNYAVFGEATWDATDRLSLTAGLRYDRETIDSFFDYNLAVTDTDITGSAPVASQTHPSVVIPGALVDDSLKTLLDQIAVDNTSATNTDFDAWLPKLSLGYKLTDDVTTFATLQRGYRSGGVSFNSLRASVSEFDPEYTDNIEIGIKGTWFDDRLFATAHLYHTDWTDQQVRIYGNAGSRDFHIDNVGESTLQGLELEFQAQLTDELQLFGNYGFADTEFQESPFPEIVGNRFGMAPEHTAALGMLYRQNNGFELSLDTNYQGSYYDNIENDQLIGSRTLLNTRVGYRAENWSVFLWGKNLTDEKYMVRQWRNFINQASDTAELGAPRTYGLTLSYLL